MTLLVATALDKAFGGVVAARNVSLAVDRGELVALIGPNGAGKSTTFNMVGGQLAPDGGSVTLEGSPITGMAPHAIWRLGVGRTFQIAQTFVSMSAVENVQIALQSASGAAFDLWRSAYALHRETALQLLHDVGLHESADRSVATLSYGDVKRVELAIALASQPKVLLMDEPTAGMARTERHELMLLVGRLARERGLGVLFTEHDMDAVFGHATRVLVLIRGEIVAGGSPDEVQANPLVRELYLGKAGARTAAEATRSRGRQ
jgi:branched-chain amino acid transport system ATP-binding protein